MYYLRRSETPSSPSSKEKVTRPEELKKEVNDLPEDDPTLCEGLIRELHGKILTIKDGNVKDQLLTELKIVSCHGLKEDLRTIVTENGLALEGLNLVLKYLTTKNELAEYLFKSTNDVVKNDGLDVVKRRLAPKLEVLGGLTSMEMDVENTEWTKNLIKEAPSLSALTRVPVGKLEKVCDGANRGEMEDVNRLVKIALFRTKRRSAVVEDDQKSVGAKDTKNKAIDEEKLKNAMALMDEAKKAATEQSEEAKKAVNEKLAEITKILDLPPDWNKLDSGTKPEQLFQELDNIIGQLNNAVEVSQSYKSDLDVVEKASGGRALCGIYYSEYVATITAERPLISMPGKVTLSSPNNSQQIRYVKFSKSRAAANYVSTVKSSSTNIGLNVGGFKGLFVGDVRSGHGSNDEEERVTSKKEKTSSASVLQYIWIATKTFKIEQEQMKLSKSAQRMASSIVKDAEPDKQSEAARCFMQRYGSHLPAGLHTLGGVLFRIVDAVSESTEDTSQLTEKAAQKLQGQVSFGLLGGTFGTAASISGEHSSSSGETSAADKKADLTSYTYSFQAMGPSATDPATFTKLLTNNSTWALIDRGSRHAYIPVWELLRVLGEDFEAPAKVLEKTWIGDENERKKRSHRVEYRIMDIIKDDLAMLRDECIKKEPNKEDHGYWPQDSAQLVFSACIDTIDLTREEAYEKAFDIIMVDPRYRICEISWCVGDKYTVRCWKAHKTEKMNFECRKGEHVLFYSKIIFKWKDDVPIKE